MIELSKQDVLGAPYDLFPMLCVSDNPDSIFSALIKWRTQGVYNHFMWYHRPGYVASQNAFFGEQPIEQYLKKHRLQFWYSPQWTMADRVRIQMAIGADLDKPKWQTRYDWLQIIGKALPWAEWINVPGTRICSDYAEYLKLTDPSYDLYHPAPAEVRRWLMAHPERYTPYGTYMP